MLHTNFECFSWRDNSMVIQMVAYYGLLSFIYFILLDKLSVILYKNGHVCLSFYSKMHASIRLIFDPVSRARYLNRML